MDAESRQYDSDRRDLAESSRLHNLNFLVIQVLVLLTGAIEKKGIGERSDAVFHAGNHVGATEPVGLVEIGFRPAGRVVRMGMIEAQNVFAALATLALNTHQICRIDVVAVVRRILT